AGGRGARKDRPAGRGADRGRRGAGGREAVGPALLGGGPAPAERRAHASSRSGPRRERRRRARGEGGGIVLPRGPRDRAQRAREVLGAARGDGPGSALGEAGTVRRGPRDAVADLRVVHRGPRLGRPERGAVAARDPRGAPAPAARSTGAAIAPIDAR